MGKYIVTAGQNIYDVAMHVYGSIEGVTDLFMNNPDLSLLSDLRSGDELVFSDDYVIDGNVVSYFNSNHIVPSNGERRVYYKESLLPGLFEWYLTNKETNVEFIVSGKGKIDIDWGDNSVIETVELQEEPQTIFHSFDTIISEQRKIRLYGLPFVYFMDLSGLNAEEVYLLRPVTIERFVLKNSGSKIDYVSLFKDVFSINLSGLECDSLLPLLDNKGLMELDLTSINLFPATIDNYLYDLVRYYYGRRSCTVRFSKQPSGIYRKPKRDDNYNYIITSGMEAIWVIVNEPAWNEGGYWKFIINDEIYTTA